MGKDWSTEVADSLQSSAAAPTMKLNEYTDTTFDVIQDTLNLISEAAVAAPNEEERQYLFRQVAVLMKNWENYSAQHAARQSRLANSAPIVNPRREAILAQKARRGAAA